MTSDSNSYGSTVTPNRFGADMARRVRPRTGRLRRSRRSPLRRCRRPVQRRVRPCHRTQRRHPPGRRFHQPRHVCPATARGWWHASSTEAETSFDDTFEVQPGASHTGGASDVQLQGGGPGHTPTRHPTHDDVDRPAVARHHVDSLDEFAPPTISISTRAPAPGHRGHLPRARRSARSSSATAPGCCAAGEHRCAANHRSRLGGHLRRARLGPVGARRGRRLRRPAVHVRGVGPVAVPARRRPRGGRSRGGGRRAGRSDGAAGEAVRPILRSRCSNGYPDWAAWASSSWPKPSTRGA